MIDRYGPLSLNTLGGSLIAEGGHSASEDRRRTRLTLTPAGSAVLGQARARKATLHEQVDAMLSPAQREFSLISRLSTLV